MRKFWKKLTRFGSKIFPAILTALTLVCSTAYAAPAVAASPVTAEILAELLVALGLITGDAVNGYVWTEDNPYVTDIFSEQLGVITDSSIPISAETLESAMGTVIPEGVYTYTENTDGSKNFFVQNKELSTSDLFLTAKSLVGVNYMMPVNINGASWVRSALDHEGGLYYYSPFGNSYLTEPTTLFGYYVTSSGSPYMSNMFLYFLGSGTSYKYSNFTRPDVFSGELKLSTNNQHMYIAPAYISKSNVYIGPYCIYDDLERPWDYKVPLSTSSQYIDLSNNKTVSLKTFYSDVVSATILNCKGLPKSLLDGSRENLDNAIVQVKKDDDDNNGSTPPASPNNWEIWKSLEDLAHFIDTGEDTNGGTTYDQFVNNNYNYVQVNVNVPDNVNVNLGGGLDINGSGSIDITIHEDLPSVGDGSGFFTPGVGDVADAVGTNPVIHVIHGLFAAIDPALLGIFTVSVSLLIVLGLWKMIRG